MLNVIKNSQFHSLENFNVKYLNNFRVRALCLSRCLFLSGSLAHCSRTVVCDAAAIFPYHYFVLIP